MMNKLAIFHVRKTNTGKVVVCNKNERIYFIDGDKIDF